MSVSRKMFVLLTVEHLERLRGVLYTCFCNVYCVQFFFLCLLFSVISKVYCLHLLDFFFFYMSHVQYESLLCAVFIDIFCVQSFVKFCVQYFVKIIVCNVLYNVLVTVFC